MSDLSLHDRLPADALPSAATVGDFVQLLKPRVMSLVVFTALVGLVAAPGHLDFGLAVIAILAIAVGGGASGALNMWYEADLDAVMGRTSRRPIPAGRVERGEALGYGLFLSALSVIVLGLATNWVAAGLLAFTIFFYVVVYTMWLKRRTSQNIVIGGAAGAFPPMIGWAAVTGGVSLESLILFAIIFVWTPPHFWALALVKSEDYARAGVPMLPVTAGDRATRWQILAYSLALAPLGMAPTFLGFATWLYGTVAALGGLAMIAMAVDLLRVDPDRIAEKASQRRAWRMFRNSMLYLFVLFAALLVERLAGA